LVESTRRRRCDATEIKWIRWVFEVLDVEKGRRKSIRVIEKNGEKTPRASLSENRNNIEEKKPNLN